MTDTTVKYFDSTMSGAPALSGTAGTLIGVLDACLVNGFGSVTVASLVVASNVATATVSAGHNLAMVGNTGPVVKIEGATPAALNGEWRVASVPNSTTFTFATSGIDDGTASGTITAKRAPAGWEKRYSDTNKAAYARLDPEATAMLLRIDDTPAQYPVWTMYESMSDVDTGTGPSTAAQACYSMKSSVASTAARSWRLVVDGRSFWVFVDESGAGAWVFNGFGDIVSYKTADEYGCLLRGGPSAPSTALYGSNAYSLTSCNTLARAVNGTGGAITGSSYSHVKLSTDLGNASQAWPALSDGSIHTCPIEIWDGTTAARGLWPGLYGLVHASPGTYDGTTFEIDGMTRLVQKLSSNTVYGCAFDITGPWR